MRVGNRADRLFLMTIPEHNEYYVIKTDQDTLIKEF